MKPLLTRLKPALCAGLLLVAALLCAACTEEPTDPTDTDTDTPSITQGDTEPMTDASTVTEAATTAAETETEEPDTTPVVTEASYTWSNPIRYSGKDGIDALRDPFILKVGDAWYMTGTLPPYGLAAEAERTKGVPLYKSTDLTTWTFVDYIVKTPAEAEGKWYSERFWAPEIFAHNGKFYVTVNCCAVDGSSHGFLFAVAEDIEGPYTIMNPDAPLAYGNDAHLVVDTDGQTYLFASGIMYAKIDLDNLRLLSAWTTAVSPIAGSDAWNGQRDGVGFEGPYVLTMDGTYYLFYSTWARGYEVGLAKADSVTGDWTMYAAPMYGGINQDSCNYYGGIYEEGYYVAQGKYRECGHNSVFEGPDGELWIAAHAYVNGNSTPMLIIDRLTLDDERGLGCLDTSTGEVVNGPTYGKSTVTYDPTSNEAAALHALDVWVYTDTKSVCTLPDEVDILLENGFRRSASVTWNSTPDTSEAGDHTVSGTAEYGGTTYTVTAHITVRNVSGVSCDFENAEVGSTDFGREFTDAINITYQMYELIGRGPAVVAEEGGNRFLRNTAYLLAELPASDNYTLSLDWRCLSTAMVGGTAERLGGICLRGGDQSRFPHYEEDSQLCIGNSGLLIMPAENGFRIVVKTFDEASGAVTHEETFLEYANGYDFTTLEITEQDRLITVKAGGSLLFTAELGDEGTYSGTSRTYYRAVTVKGADGGTLIEVSNGLLTVEPALHIVSRGWTAFDLDNIALTLVD